MSIIAVPLAMLCVACGTGASQRDTRTVVERFQAALAGSDGGAACDQLAENLRGTLEDQEGKPCRAAVLGLGLRGGGRPVGSRVYITSAIVRVPGRGAAFLDQTKRGWRISAAGCLRQPSSAEYQCRLKD